MDVLQSSAARRERVRSQEQTGKRNDLRPVLEEATSTHGDAQHNDVAYLSQQSVYKRGGGEVTPLFHDVVSELAVARLHNI